MRLRILLRNVLSRHHERKAHWHLGRAAINGVHAKIDLHRMCHLIAAMDALENKACDEDCQLNTLPKRMADRVTNVLVPDYPPENLRG